MLAIHADDFMPAVVFARRLHQRAADVVRLKQVHAPGVAEIILRARAANGGVICVAVKIKLHLAFAPPVRLQRPNADDTADKTARPFDVIQQDVILSGDGGILAAKLRVKITGVVRQRCMQFIINLIKDTAHFRFGGNIMFDGDAGVRAKRHRKITIKPPAVNHF